MASDPVETAMQAAAGPYGSSAPVDPVDAAMARAAASGPSGGADTGKFSLGQAALAYATGIPASIAAGYRGLWDLAMGKGIYQASQDVGETQNRLTSSVDPATQAGMASPNNPLNLIPKLGAGVGEVVRNDLGSDLGAAIANAGTQVFALDAGGRSGVPPIVRGAADVAGKGAKTVSNAADTVGTAMGLKPPPLTAEQIVVRQAQNSPQSMGASAAAANLSKASPQLQSAIVKAAQQTGGAVNDTALQNHLEAAAHGVDLMEGQATRDPTTFSDEQNSTNPAVMKRKQDQEIQMTDAIDNIRREAGPTTVQNNPIQNGQIAVDALKTYDQPIKADIKAKYQALVDANGGTVPIDPGQFLSNVDSALKKQYLTASIPPAASELLGSLRNGEPLDFEGFEAARSRLAEAQRDGGSSGVAAGIIRNQLEQLPLSPQAAGLKGLADTARSAAKSRFDALDADPAYQAAVDDSTKIGAPSPLADKFLDKYALGAPKANLDLMMQKLDPEAQQAVASHTLSTIRDAAITNNGKVSANGYNGAVQKYGPKLNSLVGADTVENLESLGRVITNAKVPPEGHFVNYSKSGVLRNAATGVAQEIGGAALNAKTMGLGMPIVKGVAERSFAKRVLAPGAGLTKLSDIANPP